MSSNADVRTWLARHHSVISRAKAFELGLPAGKIDYLLRVGEWQALHAGVYTPADSPPTPQRATVAAIEATGDCSAASYRSAAWLRQVIEGPPPRPSVTIPHTRRCDVRGIDVHRSRAPVVAGLVDGIRVTSLSATLRDMALVASPAELTTLVDRVFAEKMATPAKLYRALDGQRRHRGARLLIAHLEGRHLEPGDRPSLSESLLLRYAEAAGLPAPKRELVVLADGRRFKLDTAYADRMLSLEGDGHRDHSSPEQISADHDRRGAMTLLGWRILVFTYRDLRRDKGRVIRRMQQAWAATEPHGPAG